jgi:hypothetical protein
MENYKLDLVKEAEAGATYAQGSNTYTYPNHAEYFRIKITASLQDTDPDPVMTEAVFGHQNTITDPYASTSVAQFMFVCSPYQLSEYPEGAPASTGYMQFYRKNTVELYFQSQRDANTFWGEIKLAVDNLVDRLERNDDSVLVAQTAIWIPDAPTT